MSPVALASCCLAALAAAGCAAGSGTAGAGIQSAPVRPGVIRPGTVRELHVYVLNTGSGPETLTVRAERVTGGPGRTAPARWVTPRAVPLPAGGSRVVRLTLTVPPGAASGRYVTDIIAAAAPGAVPGGMAFGAAAATLLQFRVVNPS